MCAAAGGVGAGVRAAGCGVVVRACSRASLGSVDMLRREDGRQWKW